MEPLDRLQARIISCRKCPRLVRHREKVAKEKVRRFQGGEYWGKPVPSFGDRRARIVLVGLAPAAHGGNRTGRIFTGDRSGDFLFSALYRMGLASQPTSISRDDRLRLRGVYVTAAVRCAPPANRPTPQEQDKCRPYLERELGLLHGGKVIVALGALAWRTLLKSSGVRGRFAHGAEVVLPDGMVLLGCYHPSQQATHRLLYIKERSFDVRGPCGCPSRRRIRAVRSQLRRFRPALHAPASPSRRGLRGGDGVRLGLQPRSVALRELACPLDCPAGQPVRGPAQCGIERHQSVL
ncbi:MAG: hypothetical protein DMF49_09880 [Acidobacteria bacterium]|nr:MAG: hypothetical protein DMF49_09880 [Acidobacteriota bacterium]